MVAQHLALGDGDVGAELARGRQDAERERVEDLDRPGPGVVRRAEHLPQPVLEQPVEVGVLQHHGRDVLAEPLGAA